MLISLLLMLLGHGYISPGIGGNPLKAVRVASEHCYKAWLVYQEDMSYLPGLFSFLLEHSRMILGD